jgi:hypothetical protein
MQNKEMFPIYKILVWLKQYFKPNFNTKELLFLPLHLHLLYVVMDFDA